MLGDAGLFISHLLCPKIAESQVFVLCVFRVEGVMQACPSFELSAHKTIPWIARHSSIFCSAQGEDLKTATLLHIIAKPQFCIPFLTVQASGWISTSLCGGSVSDITLALKKNFGHLYFPKW